MSKTVAPKIEATPELVEKTAKTKQIKQMVRLAEMFLRAGGRKALEVELPVFASVEIAGKGYRKMTINAGTMLEVEGVHLGKAQGLIFRFKPASKLDRTGEPVAAVELLWGDIVDSVPTLYDRLNPYFEGKSVEAINLLNTQLRDTVAANKGMHAVLSKGFAKAQEEARNSLETEEVQGNELWGQWG